MADEKTIRAVFDDPPVIETVFGVQFAPLNGLTTAHLGWFWKTRLGSEWDKVQEELPILEQFEVFETASPVPRRFKIEPIQYPARLQLSRGGDGRMIQLQPTRFHYNWNRVGGGEYPHYKNVQEEFDRYLTLFSQFIGEAGFGAISPNQWELTYIDSIRRGLLWDTPADWPEVLPGLFAVTPAASGVRLDSFGGEWHFEIPPKRGRLHISVQLARVGEDPEPVLLLQTTGRGPLGNGTSATLSEGLAIGHQAAVDTFISITSEKAHQAWRRKQ